MTPIRNRVPRCRRAVTLVVILWLASALAVAQLRDERAVRAAYVFNLTKYIEWPVAGNELVIGFEGDRPTGEVFQKLIDGRTVDSRQIRVVLFPSDEELEKCHVVYLTDVEEKKTRNLLGKLGTRSVLTVGESPNFLRAGGVVGLVNSGDQIQIQVNVDAAQRAGIRISSRLLNLAVIVRERQVGGN